MRVMVIMKASPESENGVQPSEKLLSEMLAYNEELVKAGIMLTGDGLHASSKGKRVRFEGTKTTVIDGPFAETKELIAGFWIWQVKSMDEAVAWARRIPNTDGVHHDVELRTFVDIAEFGEAATPELRAKEADLRVRAEKLAKQ
jgi:hypothetical protein